VTERPPEQANARSGRSGLLADAEKGDAKAQFRLGMKYVKRRVDRIRRRPEVIGKAASRLRRGAVHARRHAPRRARRPAKLPAGVQVVRTGGAAEHAEAQYSLGVMYRNGQGVAADKSKAYVWFNWRLAGA